MKKLILIIALLAFASSGFAAVLLQEWEEGTKRYCKYSDGTIITIRYSSVCPTTN